MYSELDPNRGLKWVCLYLLIVAGSQTFAAWCYRQNSNRDFLAILGACFAFLVTVGIFAGFLFRATHETIAHYIGVLCGGIVLTIGLTLELRHERKMDVDRSPSDFTDRFRCKILLWNVSSLPIFALSFAVGFGCYKLLLDIPL